MTIPGSVKVLLAAAAVDDAAAVDEDAAAFEPDAAWDDDVRKIKERKSL